MLKYSPAYCLFIQLLFNFHSGNCEPNPIQKLQPYEYILKMHLKEPPVKNNGTKMTFDSIQEHWLAQKLDHFDASNKERWSMVS